MDAKVTILSKSELCGRQFTVYGTPEAPLFLAKEVAEIIEHSDPHKMVQIVDEDERVRKIVPTPLGGPQEMWFLTENGLYEVLMQSRKPIAKTFKKGVKQILHDVRTHGMFMTTETLQKVMNDPDFLIGLLKGYKEEKERVKELTATNDILVNQNQFLSDQNGKLTIKAQYTNDVLLSVNGLTFTQVAKDLGLSSAQKLESILEAKGIIYKQSGQWLPKARYSEKGYFTTRTVPYTDKNTGEHKSNTYTIITEKGRAWMHWLFDKYNLREKKNETKEKEESKQLEIFAEK